MVCARTADAVDVAIVNDVPTCAPVRQYITHRMLQRRRTCLSAVFNTVQSAASALLPRLVAAKQMAWDLLVEHVRACSATAHGMHAARSLSVAGAAGSCWQASSIISSGCSACRREDVHTLASTAAGATASTSIATASAAWPRPGLCLPAAVISCLVLAEL